MKNFQISFNNNSIGISVAEEIVALIHQNIFSAVISESHGQQSVFTVPRKSNRFHLFRQHQEIDITEEPHKLVHTLEWNIVDELIERSSGVFQIHGAALNYRGKSYLFIGNPGSGKTSLAILLSKIGMNLLSDEVSLVDLQNYCVYPFPRNLIIKQHLLELISIPTDQEPLIIEDNNSKKEKAFFLPVNHFNRKNQFPLDKLAKIFFLAPHQEVEFDIQMIGEHQAFNRLMPQLFNIGRLQNFHDSVINLIATIPTYILKVGKPLLLNNNRQQELLNQITSKVTQ